MADDAVNNLNTGPLKQPDPNPFVPDPVFGSRDDAIRQEDARRDNARFEAQRTKAVFGESKDKPRDIPEVDHHARIGELAVELRNASPSGTNTISDKILFHLDAIKDPKGYEAKVTADRKAEDEIEAQRAKERAALKTPADQNAKVA